MPKERVEHFTRNWTVFQNLKAKQTERLLIAIELCCNMHSEVMAMLN